MSESRLRRDSLGLVRLVQRWAAVIDHSSDSTARN